MLTPVLTRRVISAVGSRALRPVSTWSLVPAAQNGDPVAPVAVADFDPTVIFALIYCPLFLPAGKSLFVLLTWLYYIFHIFTHRCIT